MGRKLTNEERIEQFVRRMPDVPPSVAQDAASAIVLGFFSSRGVAQALQRFYASLTAAGRPPELATVDDFTAAASNRTALIGLMSALELVDTSVPLSIAKPLRQGWDHWLNQKYNKRPRKPRQSQRVSLLPEEWPESWARAVPLLEKRVRTERCSYRRPHAKTREMIIQAVGMCAAARHWAIAEGIEPSEGFTEEVAEVFLRFLFQRPRMSARSAADYFGRVITFARRARLFEPEGEEIFCEILGALEAEATDQDPSKKKKLRDFHRSFDLSDVLVAANRCIDVAEKLPAHSALAHRLRRKAVAFALLVNGADRQGDLSTFRIGREIERDVGGLWEANFRQSKTRRTKDLGPYWGVTSEIIDTHILGGRPEWSIRDRIAELDGCNLLSLEEGGYDTYHPSKLLQEEFGISGHLVRTLITNLIRQHRPDGAWAVQALLGHSSRWSQSAYKTEFRETAGLAQYHSALEDVARS
ncbi:hypothetical protein R3X27_24715 [Tropicimonas sp. TH_r6]|uniref:hypothetical protein n=1 Tax=Tropicimonas sp. TH_r6 TaxID=3082085 RepID=UPI0029553292|nr:hypothetical protein [Tropicimonas sp. TH_r6]MDV7145894.1 hypothetical protein [Tropicimonas sp. TH_r6]